jgi:acetamidase/formamidase
MDVEFSVDIIKDDASVQPRAETNDYLISFGVSGSVPESIQIATSQLATWVKLRYKLNDSEVAILFGATLKYDITELVDAKYDVVAKIPKNNSRFNEVGSVLLSIVDSISKTRYCASKYSKTTADDMRSRADFQLRISGSVLP